MVLKMVLKKTGETGPSGKFNTLFIYNLKAVH